MVLVRLGPTTTPDRSVTGKEYTYLGDRAIHVIIDDHMIKFIGRRKLILRCLQATFDDVGRLRTTTGQAFHQGLPRWRREENCLGFRHDSSDITRTDQIDLHKYGTMAFKRLPDGPCRGTRALQTAVDVGPFEHPTRIYGALKLFRCHVEVVTAVDFSGPWRTCRHGNGEEQVGDFISEPIDHRRFTDSGRPCEYNQVSWNPFTRHIVD